MDGIWEGEGGGGQYIVDVRGHSMSPLTPQRCYGEANTVSLRKVYSDRVVIIW